MLLGLCLSSCDILGGMKEANNASGLGGRKPTREEVKLYQMKLDQDPESRAEDREEMERRVKHMR